ncbi:MAG TPA: YeeE/YedE family protein [Saprospiraceae bacterium]|nr:YeeE/YedE family protein [Saprospiraceae bacterium]
MNLLLQTWPWYVAGPIIALVTFLLFYFGKHLGVSSNLETLCSMEGAGKFTDYFKIDWRARKWNLVFILGLIAGGFITSQWMTPNEKMDLNPKTIENLQEFGITDAGYAYLPEKIYGLDQLSDVKNLLFLLLGGVLVGFGARYAGGCTSGHGIVGLSNFAWASYVSVAGFFIGGLLMTWFILPFLIKLL